MIRLWFRVAVPLITGFTVYMLILHIQPAHTADLRALFMPPDTCFDPCFMGIRPGFTTVDEAITILNAHRWVKSVSAPPSTSRREEDLLILNWNGAQSPYIDTQSTSALITCGNWICGLSIPTNLELGAFLLEFGQPDSATLRSIPDAPHAIIIYAANYSDMQFTVRTSNHCPPVITEAALHHSHVILQLGDVGEAFSTSKLHAARFQMLNFQKQAYPWLLRRAFICAF